MSTLLSVENLSFNWPNREVLKNLNIEIKSNELVSILGVNGAGKTTLLKCVNRILKPSAGRVSLLAQDLSTMQTIDVAQRIAYVPQSVSTNFPMEVYDVVLLGRRPYISWFVRDEDREIVSESLEFLDLEDFAFRRYDRLSGGERQRVVLAKALAQKPNLYLLDEPTSDLDLKNQVVIMKKMRELVKDTDRNSSALIAIHDIDIAARFSDKILLMHDGGIMAYGTPEEVLTPENIAEVFGVEAEILNKSGSLRIMIHGALEKETR